MAGSIPTPFVPPDPHRGGFNGDLNTFPPGGINLNVSSLAHRRVLVCHAGQEHLSPSSSIYFGITGQDSRSVFGGMGDDAMHHIINDGSTADDAYTQEEGEIVVDEEEEAVEESSEYLDMGDGEGIAWEGKRRRLRPYRTLAGR
jgi:hypothetical protein